MSHETAVRSTPTIHRTPAPRRLSRALPTAIHSFESSVPAFDQALLDRLDAMFRSIQSVPDLDQAIRLPVVLDLVGVSKSTWYALLNPRSKTFDARAPQPFKLGPSPNSPSVWWRSAVMAYLKVCASPQAWA